MDSVRVHLGDGVFALLAVRDDVAYLAPLGSEPIEVARVGVWHVADVQRTPAWA